MLDVLVAGGMGAIFNYALFSHWFSSGVMVALDTLLEQLGLVIQMGAAINALFSVLFCLFGGTLFMLIWKFLKARMIRFLLSTNVWFLTPKSPLSKVWYMLMLALLGTKNRGSGSYQDFLPSLPVPPLKSTLKKYLTTVKPLLSDEEYKETEKCVKELESSGVGTKLNRWLKLRSWWLRNWMADWWLDFIYLRQRTPISFNSNYFALGSKRVSTPHGLDRAAMLSFRTAEYLWKDRQFKNENFMGGKTAPFCMDGRKYLAFSARIPGEEKDKLVCYGDEHPRHAVVMRNGKFYKVMVYAKNGRPLSPKVLKAQLKRITERNDKSTENDSVAALTALPRTEWAGIRKRMEERPANKKILKLIDSSLSVLALNSESIESEDMTAVGRMLFHGNINDRWFDKSIQLIICPNGTVGANVEHAPLDATVCGQMWEYCLCSEKYDENGHVIDLPNQASTTEVPEPELLEWDLEGFQDDLLRARENLHTMISDSDLVVVTPSYGKRIPKKVGLSPDGWFQMAMQLAYYRLHKKVVLTYESATTRLYYQGRTETIRPVSTHSIDFVKTFDDPNIPREEVKALLKKAIDTQCQYKLEAMRGLGVDRHLFGLYVVAKGLKLDPMPKLFTDKAFNLSFTLSTSQTPVRFSKNWSAEASSCCGGFGTVTDGGYGVSYMVITDDEVNFSIHSKRCCPDTDSKMFADALVQAFEDVKELYSSELNQ